MGKTGDEKNDGHLKSRKIIFQVYAPNEMDANAATAKIDEDYNGALSKWQDSYFAEWVFVHNSKIGLSPAIEKKLHSLEQQNPKIKITHWGFEELRQEAMQLSENDIASLLGPFPIVEGRLIEPGAEHLASILSHVVRTPVQKSDILPVPKDKLTHNLLSEDALWLLQAGLRRTGTVRQYFNWLPNPKLRDEIAASFRNRYLELREKCLSPDDIFKELQMYIGGTAVRSPSETAAILAILAYFFEECDIFERAGSNL